MASYNGMSQFYILWVILWTLCIGCLVLAQSANDGEFICDRLNESYDECGNSCGDLTCQNYRLGDIQCGRNCREGCFCKGGYVRTRSDPDEDGLFCMDPNEVYDDCGPVCGDRTCANQRKNDVSCLRACQNGCFCKGGYVRNKSRKCVPSYLCSLWLG
uniref:TIL domain-containing protein n=1 Tax=Anopheles farauti TaxID=69004 RepID=A0A182QUA8_9DIPT